MVSERRAGHRSKHRHRYRHRHTAWQSCPTPATARRTSARSMAARCSRFSSLERTSSSCFFRLFNFAHTFDVEPMLSREWVRGTVQSIHTSVLYTELLGFVRSADITLIDYIIYLIKLVRIVPDSRGWVLFARAFSFRSPVPISSLSSMNTAGISSWN